MARRTAEQVAEKHNSRMKAAIPEMKIGIENVTESPTKKAAAKQDKMLAGITKAVQDGKWARGLNRVSLEEWKAKTIEKGLGRIAAGVDAARGKVEDFHRQLQPFQDALKTKIGKMPDNTLEDRINRATVYMRGMAEFKKQ